MADDTKLTPEKMLRDVPQEKWFLCQDGRVMKNLSDLQAALKEMSEETFRHHASKTKNDFANWVKDVVGDEGLSKDLWESATRSESAKRVANRIVSLSKPSYEWSPIFRPPFWPF